MCSSYSLLETRASRAARLASLTLLAACIEPRMTPEIPIPAGAKSLAIVVSSTGTPVQYHIHLGNTPGLTLAATLEREDQVRALALGCSLDELGLMPGWQPVDAVRPLPARSLLGIAELLPDRRDWAPVEGGLAAMGFQPKVAGEACSIDNAFPEQTYNLEGKLDLTRVLPGPDGAVLFVYDETSAWLLEPKTTTGTEVERLSPEAIATLTPREWLGTFVDGRQHLFALRTDGLHHGDSFESLSVLRSLTAPEPSRGFEPRTPPLSGSPDGSELCVQLSNGRLLHFDTRGNELTEIRPGDAEAGSPGGVAWNGPGACVAISWRTKDGGQDKEGELLEWSKLGSVSRTFSGQLVGVAAIPNVGVLVGALDGALHFIAANGQVHSTPGAHEVKALAAVGESFLVATNRTIFEYVPGFGRCAEMLSDVDLALVVRDGLIYTPSRAGESVNIRRRAPADCLARF